MRLLIVALLLLPGIASAQNHFCAKQIITGSGGGVEYPFDRSGAVNTEPFFFYLGFSQDPSSSPITADSGQSLVVVGPPTRDFSGIWPNGISGTRKYKWFSSNGANYGLYHVDDDTLDLPTKWTWVYVGTNHVTTAGVGVHVRKFDTTPNNGYQVYRTGGALGFRTWVGGTGVILTRSGSVAQGQFFCSVHSFDGTGGSGASDGAVYVDELSAATSSVMEGPVPNTADDTDIGTFDYDGSWHFIGLIKNLNWTDSQARAFCRTYRGVTSNSGTHLSVTSSAPAATVLSTGDISPYLVNTSADSSIVGVHGHYAHPAIDNLVQRSSFESWPTWDETTTAGDGSASVAQDSTGTSAHAMSHITMTLTGTTSAAEVRSACITSGIGSDLYVQAQIRKGSGTTQAAVKIHEYSDASCTSSITSTDIVAATDVTTSWAEYGGLFAAASWNGSTAGYEIELHETCNGGCDSHWDAIQARSASNPTDGYCVTCDTDATCSCTLANSTITQPLTQNGWTIEAKIQSPLDGAVNTPERWILTVPGTAGNNNRIDFYWDNDLLTLDVYDSAGTKRTATVAAAGNADTEYTAYGEHTSGGVIKVCWDGSCGSTASSANMDGISTTCRVGHNSTAGGDVWIKNLKFGAL